MKTTAIKVTRVVRAVFNLIWVSSRQWLYYDNFPWQYLMDGITVGA